MLHNCLSADLVTAYRITGLGYLKFMATLNIGHDMVNYLL